MKVVAYVTGLALMTSGCTIFNNPNSIDGIGVMSCETEECVIEKIDSINHELGNGERFKFMEGYPVQSLAKMKEEGRLKITEWNGFVWTGLTVAAMGWVILPGMAYFNPGAYGDMHDCHAYYAGIPGWQYYLEHELWHCLGYKETGFLPWQGLIDQYTPAQLAIMEDEGVSRWIDTRFYREQIPRYYDDFTFNVEEK
jgi:hypothetical protein